MIDSLALIVSGTILGVSSDIVVTIAVAFVIIISLIVLLSCIIVCGRIYKRRNSKLLRTQHFATDHVLR